MVLQLAFQLNSFSLKSILAKHDLQDFNAEGASASKLLLTIPKIKFLMETCGFKVGNHCFLVYGIFNLLHLNDIQ